MNYYHERLLFSFLLDVKEHWSTHTKQNDIVTIDEAARTEDDSHIKDDDTLTITDKPFSEIEGVTTKRNEAFVKLTLIVSIPVTLLLLVVMIFVKLASKQKDLYFSKYY